MRLRLKLAILAAGKTQRQTAADTQLISENRLSELVRGWAEPRDDEKEALARALHQPVSVLFDDADFKKNPDPAGTAAYATAPAGQGRAPGRTERDE